MSFREAPADECGLGMEVFYTDTPGIGGKLKVQAEDFVVDEVSKVLPRSDNGKYVIATVTSTNWEMNRLVRQLSKALGISRTKIGFAGTKDKRAVTTQLLSFEAPLEAVQALNVHQVEVRDVFRSNKHLTIGDLVGNRFAIKVRDCNIKGEELQASVHSTQERLEALRGFPNFFGPQRFGSIRPITHLVGRSIVKGDMEGAVLWYVAQPDEEEDEQSREARKRLQEERDYAAALSYFPQKLTFERMVIGWLERHPEDYVGAIRVLPSNLQMMFVHAYQSYMFNRILSERIRRGLPLNEPLPGDVVLPADKDGLPDHDKHVPVTENNMDLVRKQVRDGRAFISGVLYGQDSVLAEGQMGEIERSVVGSEGLKLEDFKVPQIPDCNSRGSRRELVAGYKDLKTQCSDDVLDISFTLGKGCYATVLLREFMKSPLQDY
ncbi:MAG: putative tRNA pseudouridine synthase D [Methanomassiliicoccales archaeon PtaU1.Bin124]|nr:MAG: putative tRNA pseudouridine synthase D [Methanomassiliicoccales archaeon PtaU1.Bin124]